MNTQTQAGSLTVAFTVAGQPATQGSKVEQVIRDRTGAPVVRNGQALTTIRDDNPRLKDWRQTVANTALDAWGRNRGLMVGAIRLSLCFYRPRPKGHFGTGRNAGALKAGAPEYPIAKPDVLKLARAVEDALSGVVWRDDAQVVEYGTLAKRWGAFRVEICVESLDGEVERDF